MSRLWIDEARNIFIPSEDFLRHINSCLAIKKYIRFSNPYDMLVHLVVGMVHGKEVVLLDSDFSDSEILAMGIDLSELGSDIIIDNSNEFASMNSITEQIQKQPWKLWMFTSGTTGLPKKVCHTYKTLGRNIRSNFRHANDIWAFAYRFSHMAGIQVLLQALMNRNPMIYVFESTPPDVVKQMKKYHCTHISATPTFYRNLIPFIKEELPDLTDLTTGGEKYDADICKKIRQILPNVRFHNVYAATETGSILNATSDSFIIPEKYKGKVKVSENSELLIHRSLLGAFPVEGEWYNTHDLVEEKDGALHFLSRESDLINVGGYKVNPLEVEEAILKIPGVFDCLVKGKANSVLGNILIAEIIKDATLSEDEVKQAVQTELKKNMQPFKVPRLFKFVDVIERTRSGKKVRK